MIVENIGYLNLSSVLELDHFSIYATNRNTFILVIGTSVDKIKLDYAKQDRLPYKIIEGKKICSGQKVFDSSTDSLDNIDTSKWNNGNQIMAYKEFSLVW